MTFNVDSIPRELHTPPKPIFVEENMTKIAPDEIGEHLKIFLRDARQEAACKQGLLNIRRPTLFNPVGTIGLEGWRVVHEETDARSALLESLNPTSIHLVTMLKNREVGPITGEERIKRCKKAGHIRLDVGVLFAFWRNKHKIPENWKSGPDGSDRCVYFDGTVLLNSHNERCVYCLYWDANEWHKTIDWLGVPSKNFVSAVIIPQIATQRS